MNSSIYVIAADKIVDGVGDSRETDDVRDRLRHSPFTAAEFAIAPMSMPWDVTLPPGCLRCACSPLEAVLIFKDLLARDEAHALVLSGRDYIRTGYEKSERNKFMQIYGEGETPLTGYTKLAPAFLDSLGMTKDEFHTVRERLFENYLGTYQGLYPDAALPGDRWYAPVTEYFRGVDCANPSVDFSGCVVIGTAEVAEYFDVAARPRIRVTGCSLLESGPDGLTGIGDIVPYRHLTEAYNAGCAEAGIDFTAAFLAHEALLEVYTCYPIAPLAFLLKSGLVTRVSELSDFLARYEVTITGGLNLAKAPWNNTTLRSLVTMVKRLEQQNSKRIGGIHGNGSLGYKQGFMIVEREA